MSEHLCRQRAAPHPYVERAVDGRRERAGAVVMGGEDDDPVAVRDQVRSGVDDEALGAAEAEIRMEEDHGHVPASWKSGPAVAAQTSCHRGPAPAAVPARSRARRSAPSGAPPKSIVS